MATLQEYKGAYFRSKLPSTKGNVTDLEYAWLKTQVTPYVGTIPDMWKKFFVAKGYTKALPDSAMAYLKGKGFTTGSLSDRWFDFYKALTTP